MSSEPRIVSKGTSHQTESLGLRFKSKAIPVECQDCGQVIGVVDSSRTVFRIKYKDLFLYIKGGDVTLICRKCASINYFENTPTTDAS